MKINSFIELEDFFNSFKNTTFHKLKDPTDENGKIMIIKGTDKPLFWLLINEIDQKYDNFFYWISGSFKSNENLYVLLRIVDKSIINHDLKWDELSKQSYNEIIEFGKNFELFNEAAEKFKNETKKETKKRRTKKEVKRSVCEAKE